MWFWTSVGCNLEWHKAEHWIKTLGNIRIICGIFWRGVSGLRRWTVFGEGGVAGAATGLCGFIRRGNEKDECVSLALASPLVF
jgi:hypothetical protein